MSKEISKQRQIEGAKKSAEIQKQRKKIRIEEYNKNPIICKICGSLLSYDKRHNKFCGRSCSVSFNNRKRNKSLKKCVFCGLLTNNTKYCSHKCHKRFEWNRIKKRIEETMIASSHREGKKYLLRIKGNECEICGIKEWNNKEIIMVLDHISGNSEDNSLDNLRLICPNCDSQTITYKGKNIGNGRHNRRKRYAEGKSY